MSQVYLTVRSVPSLNNSQTSEMKICGNMKFDMFKIIIIILGYALNNFTNSCDNVIVDHHGKFNNFKF